MGSVVSGYVEWGHLKWLQMEGFQWHSEVQVKYTDKGDS